MKIRAIELQNLRRFGGLKARIDGIGDGVSVLSEPNEFGKSTFLDALQALFFERHGSTRAQVKALRPHSGGAPEARVELELPAGRYTLHKRWLSRATAQVFDASGRLIARDDEAEAFIDSATGGGAAEGLAGPTGLLWVRQGVLGMEPEGGGTAGTRERERGLAARRDLLSSVAGEIAAMTGGRRMDQVLARVGAELAGLATATGKPKAGGDWAQAVDDADRLASQRVTLAAKAERLTRELAERARAQSRIAQLDDPAAQTRDAEALAQARQRHEAARAHAERIANAETRARLAQMGHAAHVADLARLCGMQDRLSEAERQVVQTRENLARASADHDGHRIEAQRLELAHQAARAATRQAEEARERASRARLAAAASQRLEGMRQRLERAEGRESRLAEARADRAALRITAPALERLEARSRECEALRARREAGQVALSLRHTGAARARIGMRELGDETLRLDGRTEIELPGFGQLVIAPGEGAEAGDLTLRLAAAEAALAEGLATLDLADLTAARRALMRVGQLDAAIVALEAELAELAPQGMASLREALAVERARADVAPSASDAAEADPVALDLALGQAREREEAARAAILEAEARARASGERRAGAEAAAQAHARSHEALLVEVGSSDQLTRQRIALEAQAPDLAAVLARAEADLADLRAAAPDLEATRASFERLASVLDGRSRELARLRQELASISGSISALADEGIEEELALVSEREVTARARAQRFQREAEALMRLRKALSDARSEARDSYFAPVLRELEPLLALIHPGARLTISEDSLLPSGLDRHGQIEELDILSGGTREQIAILTRLAFARLFARKGQPVPVILDDALVHSDDTRIEAMFDALHRVSRDQQILVLTCRQRAFENLGGARLQTQISAL